MVANIFIQLPSPPLSLTIKKLPTALIKINYSVPNTRKTCSPNNQITLGGANYDSEDRVKDLFKAVSQSKSISEYAVI